MKKILLSFLAVAVLASCAKSGIVLKDEAEIRLAPKTLPITKADHLGVISGIDYPTTENFDVYGYWSADWESSEVVNYLLPTEEGSGVEFVYRGEYWTGKTAYYWPKDGSLKFACYSPSSQNIQHDYATDTYTKQGYVHPSATSETWDLLLAPLTGAYTIQTAKEHVAVAFEHALAWITLKVSAGSEVAAKAFDINKITINGVSTKADLSAKMFDGIQAQEWTGHTQAADYVVFEGSQFVTQTPATIENNAGGTIVIPQETTNMTVEYTQREIENSTAELKTQSILLDLTLGTNCKLWEPGKHYTYNLVFNLDEIRIKPVVKIWDTLSSSDVNVSK